MIFLTGDTHGDFGRIFNFYGKKQTTKEDILIILGDVGINWVDKSKDIKRKRNLQENLPITLFCIHGNHENRPMNISTYKEMPFHGGIAYVEEEYPNIIFAKDGEIYDFNNKKCIVIGGAYSVDKGYRLAAFENDKLHRPNAVCSWFEDEQPSEEIKDFVEKQLENCDNTVDFVFTHTCPYNYMPVEMFSRGVDSRKVDYSTENWFQYLLQKIKFKKWYCGHYHTNKHIWKIEFLFDKIVKFGGK